MESTRSVARSRDAEPIGRNRTGPAIRTLWRCDPAAHELASVQTPRHLDGSHGFLPSMNYAVNRVALDHRIVVVALHAQR